MSVLEGFWLPPPADWALSSDDIHIWRASLDVVAPNLERLQFTLDEDELKRAERFYFQKDRVQFIVARGLLRAILSCYLHMEPSQFRFYYNLHGKPALATESSINGLNFNLSHCHGLALYAVTRGRAVGIDLERLRVDFAYEQIADHFFSPRENAVLHSLPAHLQHEAFFICWTRKEAYIKARGEGLSLPLNQLNVYLTPGKTVMLLNEQGATQGIAHLSLQDLNPGASYVATGALEGYDYHLSYFQWPL